MSLRNKRYVDVECSGTGEKHYVYSEEDVREALKGLEALRSNQVSFIENLYKDEEQFDDVKKAHITELFNMKVWIHRVFGFEGER